MFSEFDDLFDAGADVLFEQLGVQDDRFRVRLRYYQDHRWTNWAPIEVIDLPEERVEEFDEMGRDRVRRKEIHIRNRCVRLPSSPGIDAEVDIGGTIWAVDDVQSLSPNIVTLMLVRPETVQRYAPTRGEGA